MSEFEFDVPDARDYRVTFTVEAAEAADRMAPHRRELLGRGLSNLARDPYHKASAPVGTHQDNRKAQVAPGILIEYLIGHGLMVVAVVTVFDEDLFLV
ncbi:type II toxin-antitoxin system RelE family toxin [Streptomyces sp. 4N509B]|uniref:type II toxin-antitoxin system RelE family toxin n=1 Tax=Streptomyces sp. 4N509B TaxID=3457413 RepID=UPI003FD3CBBB